MFSNTGKIIMNHHAINEATKLKIGIEVESDRATLNGEISTETYPKEIGISNNNPWITTDFLQAMTEVVTPPAPDTDTALYYLTRINNALRNGLADNEILWPLSMPPKFYPGRGKELNANPNPHKNALFTGWVDKHNFHGGTPCGVHVNLNLDDKIIDLIFANQNNFKTKSALMTHLYLKIGQGFFKYRWLITYLFGASPIAEANYFEDDHHPHHPIRSLRQSSKYGYGVSFTADFTSLDTYVDTLKQAYIDHILFWQTEGHGPVRYRGNNDLDQLKTKGIKYIEVRMLDLDPTSPVGISTDTLSFFRLLTVYFAMTPHIEANQVKQDLDQANKYNDIVATERPDECHLKEQLQTIMNKLQKFANQTEIGAQYQKLLFELNQRILSPQLTPSGQLAQNIKNNSLVDYALKIGKNYQKNAKEALKPFKGFDTLRTLSSQELNRRL